MIIMDKGHILNREEMLEKFTDKAQWVKTIQPEHIEANMIWLKYVEEIIDEIVTQCEEEDLESSIKLPKYISDWYKDNFNLEKEEGKQKAIFATSRFGYGHGLYSSWKQDEKEVSKAPKDVYDWVFANQILMLDALVKGWYVDEKWIVELKSQGHYFGGFREGILYYQSVNRNTAFPFEVKKKADAVATLIDGNVREL